MTQALRFYLARPGFTLVALLTLASGIGAVTAVFNVANAVLLRPLPYANPERLVIVWEDGSRRGGSAQTNVASSNYVDWRAQNRAFDDMAIVRNVTLTLTSLSDPYSPLVHRVSSNYFQLLGTTPLLGRPFGPGEDAGSRPAPVVILSFGLWQRQFGGDPGIVGRSLLLDDEAHTVIGVMPRDFHSVNFIPTQPDLWVPLSLQQIGLERHVRRFLVVGRLKSGVTLAQAREEMNRVATHLQERYPDTNTDWRTTVTPIREQIVGDFRRPLVLLMLAAGFVLAITCFNVAIVSQSLARRWFPDSDPLGQVLSLDNPRGARPRIVGIVGDVVSAGVDPTPRPVFYLSYAQHPTPVMTFVVRIDSNIDSRAAAVARGARQVVLGIDRTLPVYDMRMMEDSVAESRWVSRFTMMLLGVFALLSLLLVAAGTYAVLAFIVSQRTQEIGIRLALGATRRNILAMIVGRGAALAIMGCALGTLAYAWGHSMLAALLYGVGTFDLPIYASVLTVLLAVTLLACYIPARTATRVSPVSALRHS